ncbi:MAG: hypothetical protein KDA84_16780, partial [Planctomycetaceae bacterium]|nr:hypothetical protein [Planctomycetaceae bacterium]
MVFLIPLAIWSCEHIHLENRVENWLPDDDPQAQILNWTHEYFSQEDRLLITWDDSSLADPRLETFYNKLNGIANPSQTTNRKSIPEIAGVVAPQDLFDKMVERGIDEQSALNHLSGVLIGRGPLRVRLTPEAKPHRSEIEQQLVEY